jgi:hypothetical protein
MKLRIPCAGCLQNAEARAIPEIALVEFRDDGRYEAQCAHGHQFIAILQEQLFELLFDIGAYAIVDGYYREAVSSFSSSLERFYEFFIRAVLLDKKVGEAAMRGAWNAVSKQSERQLGAFVFLYTSEFGRYPVLLTEKDVQFRNDVIHRGKIPQRQDALDYGQRILNLIRPTLRDLREKTPDGIREVVSQHLTQSSNKGAKPNMSMTSPTILGLNRTDAAWQSRSLEQAIQELPSWR